MTESQLAYYRTSRAWYWDSARPKGPHDYYDEIGVQRQALNEDGGDDGCLWEFGIRWYKLGERSSAFRIEIFDDALDALTTLRDLWVTLQDTRYMIRREVTIDPDTMETILQRHGFVDVTQTKDPYAESAQPSQTVKVTVEIAGFDEAGAEERVLEHLHGLAGVRKVTV